MVDPENLSASARMHIKWLCVRKSLSAVRGEDAPVLLLHVTASSYKLACLESELAFQNWDLDDCRDNHNDTCRHPQCARCYCISQGMCPQLLALDQRLVCACDRKKAPWHGQHRSKGSFPCGSFPFGWAKRRLQSSQVLSVVFCRCLFSSRSGIRVSLEALPALHNCTAVQPSS
jgi:hypothetical protein